MENEIFTIDKSIFQTDVVCAPDHGFPATFGADSLERTDSVVALSSISFCKDSHMSTSCKTQHQLDPMK